jgi:hypothetical protein
LLQPRRFTAARAVLGRAPCRREEDDLVTVGYRLRIRAPESGPPPSRAMRRETLIVGPTPFGLADHGPSRVSCDEGPSWPSTASVSSCDDHLGSVLISHQVVAFCKNNILYIIEFRLLNCLNSIIESFGHTTCVFFLLDRSFRTGQEQSASLHALVLFYILKEETKLDGEVGHDQFIQPFDLHISQLSL